MKVNSGQAPSTLIPEYLGSDFDKVVSVAENLEYVKQVAESIAGLHDKSYVGPTPPTHPVMGSEWYCTTDGRTYIWYEDEDSSQWVESSPQGTNDDLLQDLDTILDPKYKQIFEVLRRSYAEAGDTLVNGSFEKGGTLNSATDVLLYEKNGKAYSWDGVFPKVVSAGTDPTAIAGFVIRSAAGLQGKIASSAGAGMIGTDDGRSVQERLNAIPDEVDAAGTAASLVAAHNNMADAHPQLSAFITAEADRAKQAADAASLSGDVYPDTASGLASTTNGKYFSVVSPVAEGYLDLYRNNAGVAAYQKTYPSSALVKRLDAGFNKLTGSNGFSADGGDGMSTLEVPAGEKKALVIGDHSNEFMIVDSVAKKVGFPVIELVDANVSKIIHMSDTDEPDSERTEDLTTSTRAKVIGSAKHSLVFDTVNGELVSTFKIVDASQNYDVAFDDDVPSVVTGIPPEYTFANRLYQAIPTIAKVGSRFWLSWRADVITRGEGCGNFFVIGYSDDNCNTVTESHVIRFNNLNHQLIDTMLWVNPETNELWIFWSSSSKAQPFDGVLGCWCSVLENPTAKAGFSWSVPYRYRNVGHPRRPVRVAGKWIQCIDNFAADAKYLPVYPETTGCEFVEFDPRTKRTVNIGHNSPNYGAKYTGFFETELIQLVDGRLMSTTRSLTGKVTTRSFSSDGGATWSPQEPYTALGETASSRMWLGRTPSGRLLVVYNNHQYRTNMVVKLSDDEGETYPYSVVLEGPATPQLTSYPVVAFDGDMIYVTYDYGRGGANEIRVTTVRESEIVAGTSVPDINIVSGPTTA